MRPLECIFPFFFQFVDPNCCTISCNLFHQKKSIFLSLCPSRDQQPMNLSSFIATSSSTASSPIASNSPGMPIASGKPDSRTSSNSFDDASTSQMRLKDAYFGGLMEKQRGNPSHQEEEDSEDFDNPEAEIWHYKGEPFAQNSKVWRQPLAHGASSSVGKESQKDTEATWNRYLQISHGGRLLHGQENLWKIIWRSCGRFECEIPLFEQQFISEKTLTCCKMDSVMSQNISKVDSCIHYTNDFQQCCHVGNTAQRCRLVLFHVPISWMCKKHISVSQFNRI